MFFNRKGRKVLRRDSKAACLLMIYSSYNIRLLCDRCASAQSRKVPDFAISA